MSYIAYGVTASGERVWLSVERAVSPTGMVIPSVLTAGQAFERVVVDAMPDPVTRLGLGAVEIGLVEQSDGSIKVVP